MNTMREFGIIKETTQIPANLVSGDDNNAFLSQTWLKHGEKIFPQEILAQLKQSICTDSIQYPHFSMFAP